MRDNVKFCPKCHWTVLKEENEPFVAHKWLKCPCCGHMERKTNPHQEMEGLGHIHQET